MENIMNEDTDAAWAVICDSDNASFIEGVVRKLSNRGAPVDPDEFRQDLICDVVASWSQTHTNPKTGERRAEPVHPRVFIYMRARKIRTYRNRAIDRQRKRGVKGGLDTCTGHITHMGDSLPLPADVIGTTQTQEASETRMHVSSVLQVAIDVASPEELWALRTIIKDCSASQVMARTGLTIRERDKVVQTLGHRITAAL